jgi:hypothetical protein
MLTNSPVVLLLNRSPASHNAEWIIEIITNENNLLLIEPLLSVDKRIS